MGKSKGLEFRGTLRLWPNTATRTTTLVSDIEPMDSHVPCSKPTSSSGRKMRCLLCHQFFFFSTFLCFQVTLHDQSIDCVSEFLDILISLISIDILHQSFKTPWHCLKMQILMPGQRTSSATLCGPRRFSKTKPVWLTSHKSRFGRIWHVTNVMQTAARPFTDCAIKQSLLQDTQGGYMWRCDIHFYVLI